MALTAGSVSVNPTTGAVTKSGMAGALFDALAVDENGSAFAQDEDHATTHAMIGRTATSLAAAIVNHITTNAVVTVTVKTTDTGLQTTPNPNDPGVATAGPASNKTITGTVG